MRIRVFSAQIGESFKSSLSRLNVSRSTKLTALLCIAALVCFAALLLQRYRSGLNYLPVHVSLGQDEPEGSFRVFCQSPFGSIGELTVDPRYRSRWKQWPSLSAVKRLFVSGGTPEELAKRKLAVWVGESSKTGAYLKVNVESAVTKLADLDGIAVVELKVEPNAPSQLRWARDSVNWQGDAWLVIVPSVQTVLGGILCYITWFFLCHRHATSVPWINTNTPGHLQPPWRAWLCAIVFNGAWLAMLLFLIQHASSSFYSMFASRFAEQYLFGAVILALIGTAVAGFVYLVRGSQNDKEVHRCAFVGIGIIFLAKVGWIACLDSVQPMDYEQYWEYGTAMAAGDWDSIRLLSHVYKWLYVVRSFVYAFPVAKIFGASLGGLEIANVLVQVLTMIIFYLVGRDLIGARAACISIPFFAMYPDVWFAPTLATHETPALLWMACLFWLVEKLRRAVQRSCDLRFAACVQFFVLATLTGVTVAIIDLQRSYGPFVVGATIVYTGFVCLRYVGRVEVFQWAAVNRAIRRNLGICLLVILVASTAAITVHRGTVRYLETFVGAGDRTSTLGMLTANESSKSSYVGHTLSWRFLYYPALPAEEKTEFAIRKLLWEKSRADFWRFLVRNNEILQEPDFVMQFAYCGMHGDSGAASWDISYWQMRRFICNGVYCCLCLFSILRLVLIKEYPLADGEAFMVGFSISGVVAILTLTVVTGPYDTFLVFPLAWNAGMLVAGVGRSRVPAIPYKGVVQRLKWGLVFAGVILISHKSLTVVVDTTGLSLPPFGSAEDSVAIGESDEVQLSPNRVSLAFREFEDRRIPAEAVSLTVPIPDRVLKTNHVRFFLTGDQRTRQILNKNSGWENIPITYSLTVGTETVASGPLSDLSVPQFIRHKFSEQSRNGAGLGITLTLHNSQVVQLSDEQQWPVVAVEYLY